MFFFQRQFYFRIIRRKTKASGFSADSHIDVLSDTERHELNRNAQRTVVRSAVLGGVMILLLVIPQWLLPDVFAGGVKSLRLVSLTVEVNLYSLLWSVFLIVIELVILNALHLAAIRNVAIQTGYASWSALKADDRVAEKISAIAMQQKPDDIQSLGFDPYSGISKVRLYLIGLLSVVKAAISNWILRALLLRILGRYAVREVLDIAGVPVYAFWNGFTTWRLLRSARIAFTGEHVLRDWMGRWQHVSFAQQEIQLFHEAAQQVFMMRRSYHPNLIVLGRQINDMWQRSENMNTSTESFLMRCNQCSNQAREVIHDIILLGIVLGEVRFYRSSPIFQTIQKSETILLETSRIKDMRSKLRKGEPIMR